MGQVSSLVGDHNPWHAFKSDDPIVTVFRAQKVPISPGHPGCEAWVGALQAEAPGRGLPFGAKLTEAEWEDVAESAWKPWREDDARAVLECEEAPCDVKLSPAEASKLKSAKGMQRMLKYLSVIYARVSHYKKTGERKEYEFPGDPVDPWKTFEKLGLQPELGMPATSELRVRRVDLAPGKVREIRQVLDRRGAVSTDRQESAVWIRDAYSDHYFDGWGEFADVKCDSKNGSAIVTQSISLELDLMKKGDLISKMARGKMRGSMEDNGLIYLDSWFKRVERRAQQLEAPVPPKTRPPAAD
jgi:hypothetical protein